VLPGGLRQWHPFIALCVSLSLSVPFSDRLDTTLIDFTDMKCQRGDLSFIFTGDAPPAQSFVVLDNEAKVYQRIHHEVSRTKTWFPQTDLSTHAVPCQNYVEKC